MGRYGPSLNWNILANRYSHSANLDYRPSHSRADRDIPGRLGIGLLGPSRLQTEKVLIVITSFSCTFWRLGNITPTDENATKLVIGQPQLVANSSMRYCPI
jgi:hypothetical protein